MKFKLFLESQEDLNLPPERGTAPIPEGCVRLYHQTDKKNIPSIKENGILTSMSRGKQNAEPSVIWADIEPYYGIESKRPTIEFYIPEEEFSPPYYVMSDKIPPEQIIAIHETWHETARYLIKDYKEINQELIDFWMSIDDDHKKAVQFYLNYMKSIDKL